MSIGQRIRELRIQKGITQEELSAATGISVRSVQRIENDEVSPRPYTVRELARVLEVPYDQLAAGSAREEKPGKHCDFWLPLLHLSGIPLVVLPTLFIWLLKKEELPEIKEQGIAVINFQLSLLLIIVPSAIFSILLIPVILIIITAIFGMAVCVINTIRVMNSQPASYPMIIRFLDARSAT